MVICGVAVAALLAVNVAQAGEIRVLYQNEENE